MKLHRLLCTLVIALGLGVVACGGGGPAYKVPVDSPLQPFKAPETEELTGDSGGDADLTQPVEDTPSDGGGESKGPAPAPAPVATPAAKAPAKATAAKP